MEIFENTAQAVRFAFVLAQYPTHAGTGLTGIVRVALNEAHIEPPQLGTGETPMAQATAICTYAAQLRITIKTDLLGYEAAALIAAYSCNWPERRGAADLLVPFHAKLLARLLDNRTLIGKLVTRHYIAERERAASWSLAALAREHKAPLDRTQRAAHLIDSHARQLENVALGTLRIAMEKKEPAHA